ncbi:MAG TPA: phage/plasmid primase, P4 family, partial [Nitrospira sp.]|nr:phage/plasmid primase, P4 family [Nitrospira sp.]
ARFSQQRGVSVGFEDFDSEQNSYYISVQNGVLDLRSGELLAHDPKLMLTRKMNATYDPNAQAPQWTKFMEEVLPDPHLRAYVQRAMGYTLLGEADRRAMFLLYGPSGTGKSQFIEAMNRVFGDFATTAAASTFRKKHGNSTSTNDLHGLKGRRLISSSETSETSELDEELIKRLTGRDQITSRDLYEKYQTWVPEGAVWLTTNYLPKLSSDDNAVWLRMKAIEFSQVFVDTDKDRPNVGIQIAKTEAAGILNWLLEGIQLYRQFGLEEPDKVKQSNADHRRESDNVTQFLEEAFDEGQIIRENGANGLRVTALFDRYEHWCKRNHIAPLGMRRFNQRCVSIGLVKERRGGFYFWLGVRLNDAYGLMGTMT